MLGTFGRRQLIGFQARWETRTGLVLILAVSIGGVLLALSLRRALDATLPYPGSVVVLRATDDVRKGSPAVSGSEIESVRESVPALGHVAAMRPVRSVLSMGVAGARAPMQCLEASEELFALLGVRAVAGRLFGDSRDASDGAVVLSESFWRRRLAGRGTTIGSSLEIDGRELTVVGIASDVPVLLPPDFGVPPEVDAYLPLRLESFRELWWLRFLGDLAPKTSPPAAQAQVEAVAANIAGIGGSSVSLALQPLAAALTARSRPAVAMLLVAAFAVLVLAVVSISHLAAAEIDARRGELAVRAALGAERRTLVGDLLAEDSVLALVASAIGIWAARSGLQLIVAAAPTDLVHFAERARIPPGMAVAGWALSTLALCLGALPPILAGTKRPLLAAAGRRVAAAGRFRGGLVAAEVTFSVVLLFGMALVVRSTLAILGQDPGYRIEDVGYMTVRLTAPEASRTLELERIERLLGAGAGVEAVGATSVVPLSRRSIRDGYAFDAETERAWGRELAEYRVVTPGAFEALGIRLQRGRFLSQDDLQAGNAVVVDEALVARAWPDGNPLGRRLRTSWGWKEVVGVVAPVRDHDPRQAPVAHIYAPYSADPHEFVHLLLRFDGDPAAHLAAAVRELHRREPGIPVFEASPLAALASDHLVELRCLSILLGLFAAVGLVVALLGIAGLVVFELRSQARSLAVRRALGASPTQLARQAAASTVAAVALGLGVGAVTAPIAARLGAAVLFGIGPGDPRTLVAVIATVGMAGLVTLAAMLSVAGSRTLDAVAL